MTGESADDAGSDMEDSASGESGNLAEVPEETEGTGTDGEGGYAADDAAASEEIHQAYGSVKTAHLHGLPAVR